MKAIETKNLTVSFGDHKVIDDISFEIETGSVVAIVGPNGSGKTTLLKTLLGFNKYEGEVTILGYSVKDIRKIANKIGYVPQKMDFDRTIPMTVRELLNINGDKTMNAHFDETIKLLSVDKLIDKQLGVLSGGQFQRVLLAMALQHHPEILFLDEPTAGIDVEGSGEIYDLIQKIRETDEMTIVMVSHDIDVVYKYTDQVLCINHKLICHGTPEQAFTDDVMKKLYGENHTANKHG